jgi:PKD repeat protein
LSAFKNGVLTPLLPSFKAQNLTTGILTPLQGNWLNPAELVPGKYELFIDFAGNPTDCPNTSKRDTSIYFKITATPSNLKVIAERDYNSKTMRFSIAPNSTVTQQQWNFGNWLTTSPTVQYPINPNNQGNMPLLNYALIATNASGCSQQINHTFKIDFDYQGQYIHQTKPTRFTNNSSIIGDSTYSYLWHFGDGTTSTVQNPTHHYQKPDTYKVSLTIQTPTATYTLHRNIDIFPLVKIQTNKPYYTNAQNWITHGTVADSIQKTSWQIHNNIWQMPQGYANQEQSCIESPTFDIGNLTYPMLSFDYQLNTQAEADGVAFLYTLDDGKTWQRLGELGQGIAWYNTKPILGKPGNRFTQTNSDAQGWSGSSNGWQTAHIALDRTIANLSNNPIIRFRLAFGSNADNPPSSQYKGFAFRNFQLRNRNRVALLEHFTNQGIPNAPQKSANLHQIISSSHEITSIHYHTNFPAIDQLNLQNPKDPSARALHYGLPNVPANVANGKPKDSLSILQLKDTLLKQTLLPALFAINIKKLKWQNNQLQSQVELVALQDLNQPIVLHAAIVDSTQSTTNGQVYPQTLRKMLPDAAGIFKNKAWKQGEAQTTTFYWNPSQPIINTTKSKLLVFIADYSTRKIYQATTQKIPTYTKHNGEQTTITSMPLSPTQAPQPLAYPNPTNEELTLNLPMSLNPSPNIRWQIINSLGKPVKQGHWASRTHQHQIYSGDLPVGAYLIKIYDAKNPRQSFKIKIKKIR